MLPKPPDDQSDFVPPPTRHLRIERGGLYISREVPAVNPAEWFSGAVREAAAAAKRNDTSTAYSCPTIAQLAVDSHSPFARRIYLILEQNLRGGGPVEFGERIGHAILTLNQQLARKFGRVTRDEDKGAA